MSSDTGHSARAQNADVHLPCLTEMGQRKILAMDGTFPQLWDVENRRNGSGSVHSNHSEVKTQLVFSEDPAC